MNFRKKKFTSHLYLHIVQARNLPVLDSNGHSDPYTKVTINHIDPSTSNNIIFPIYTTVVAKKTLNPCWFEELVFFVPKDYTQYILSLQVWDADYLIPDDFSGELNIPLKYLEHEELLDKWYPLEAKTSLFMTGNRSTKKYGEIRLISQFIHTPPKEYPDSIISLWTPSFEKLISYILHDPKNISILVGLLPFIEEMDHDYIETLASVFLSSKPPVPIRKRTLSRNSSAPPSVDSLYTTPVPSTQGVSVSNISRNSKNSNTLSPLSSPNIDSNEIPKHPIHNLMTLLITNQLIVEKSRETLYRSNTILTKMLAKITNLNCEKLLASLLNPVISVLQKDPNAFVIKKSWVSPNATEQDKLDFASNSKTILETAKEFIRRTIKYVLKDPFIPSVAHLLDTLTSKKIPNSRYTSIAGYIFLRVINPAIIAPERLIKVTISSPMRTSLVTFAKLIQNLANQIQFTSKQPHMMFANEFIQQEIPKLQDFMDKVSSPSSQSMQVNGIDGIDPVQCELLDFDRQVIFYQWFDHILHTIDPAELHSKINQGIRVYLASELYVPQSGQDQIVVSNSISNNSDVLFNQVKQLRKLSDSPPQPARKLQHKVDDETIREQLLVPCCNPLVEAIDMLATDGNKWNIKSLLGIQKDITTKKLSHSHPLDAGSGSGSNSDLSHISSSANPNGSNPNGSNPNGSVNVSRISRTPNIPDIPDRNLRRTKNPNSRGFQSRLNLKRTNNGTSTTNPHSSTKIRNNKAKTINIGSAVKHSQAQKHKFKAHSADVIHPADLYTIPTKNTKSTPIVLNGTSVRNWISLNPIPSLKPDRKVARHGTQVVLNILYRFTALAKKYSIRGEEEGQEYMHINWTKFGNDPEFNSIVIASCELQKSDVANMTRTQSITFFCNVFSCLFFHIIGSIGNPRKISSFFYQYFYQLGPDLTFSLADIYHGIFRGNRKISGTSIWSKSDPRTVFIPKQFDHNLLLFAHSLFGYTRDHPSIPSESHATIRELSSGKSLSRHQTSGSSIILPFGGLDSQLNKISLSFLESSIYADSLHKVIVIPDLFSVLYKDFNQNSHSTSTFEIANYVTTLLPENHQLSIRIRHMLELVRDDVKISFSKQPWFSMDYKPNFVLIPQHDQLASVVQQLEN